MSISATSRITATTPHPMRRAGDMVIERDAAPVAGVAGGNVVQTEAPSRSAPPSLRSARPDAAFLAQLIATADQHPQTRALRRADVAVADAAYQALAYPGMAGSLTRRTA